MGRPVRGPPPRQRRRGRNDAPLLSRIADESPSPPRDSRTAVDADRQWEAIPPPPPAPAFAPLRRRQPPRTRRSPSAMAPRPPRRITHPPKYVHNPHGRRIARARCSQHPTATAASLKSPPSPRHPPLGPRPPPQRHHLGRTAPPYQGWGAAAPHSPTPAKACGRSRRRVFPTDRRRKRLVVQGAAGRGARTQGERYCKTGRRAPRATSRVRLCVAARDSVAARRRRQGLGVEDGVEGGGLHLHQRLPRLCERRDMHGADGEKQEKETMIGRGRQHNQQRAADASATRPTRRRYASQIHPPVTSPPLSSDSSVCRLPGRRNRYRSGTVTIAQHWRGRLV